MIMLSTMMEMVNKYQGYIALHRQIQDNFLFMEDRQFSKFEAWIHILLMANHSDAEFLLGNELIKVKRGQFITSELKLMKEWKWSKSKLRAFLLLLEQQGMIIKKSDNKKTALTVVNYGDYQDSKTAKKLPSNHEQTSKEHQKDTNKNEENDSKNENNEEELPKPNRFSPPILIDIKSYFIEKELTNKYAELEAIKFYNFYDSKNWMVGKNKMSKWKSAASGWLSRIEEQGLKEMKGERNQKLFG